MKLTVAGEKKEYQEGLTIAELIALEKVETPEYVSVSVNEAFAQSGAFAETVLKDGDIVEFLYFMGGGAGSADGHVAHKPCQFRVATRPRPHSGEQEEI